MPTGAMAVLFLTVFLCAPGSRPIVGEVFYDAIGDDTGLEFVEIFNPTAQAYPLSGLRVEAGDGSGPGRWSLRWTGQVGDSIAPGARFVVGGGRVAPPPQAVVALDLQNGPDALRLVWPDGEVEVLGYGAHEFSEYACGSPAPDVPAGRSLARVPDDANLGGNALDFRPATPSPGRANQPGRDVAWVAGSLSLDPEQPLPPRPARLAGVLTNLGRSSIGPGEVTLVGATRGGSGSRLFETALGLSIAPGDSGRFEVEIPAVPEGKHTIVCRLEFRGDEVPANDTDSLVARIGPGPLEITEIQFHPAHGEGEWVEVRNRSGSPVDLLRFTISDRGPTRGRPEGGGGPVGAESLAVLAQDRAALLGRYSRLDGARVLQVRPWPSLNNSDDASGIADAVVLREDDGTPCARQAYSAAGVPSGVPLERGADDAWRPALDPGGSPLSPPRALSDLPHRFDVSPRRLRAGSDRALIEWSLPWSRGRVAVDLYDLAGGTVGRVVPERSVSGRGETTWATDGLAPGVYLVVLRARAESGGGTLTAARALRVDGVAP